MKKAAQTKAQKDQKGIALIVMVLLILFVLIVAILEMLITTGTQLQETNLEIARTYADRTAIATSSPIRKAIDETVYSKIHVALKDHLQLDKNARAKPNSPQATYTCQGLVNTDTTKLSEIYSICDPNAVLTNPNPLISKTAQTINDLAQMMPKSTPLNPDVKYRSALKELQRESFNSFDYQVEIVFVGQDVLQDGIPRRVNIAPKPRIERYRWLARATLTTHTYEDVYLPYTISYDVVTTVTIFDEDFNCGPGYPPAGFHGFSAYPFRAVLTCSDGVSDPNSAACPQVNVAMYNPNAGGAYGNACGSSNTDGCLTQALNTCSREAIESGICDLGPGKAFIAQGSTNGTYTSTGCATSTAGASRAIGGYSWITAIRIVGIGTNYD